MRRESPPSADLQAALACFAEDGFHQTGMADIVRRSGMSHGAVYGYFQSKDEIIEALADDRHGNDDSYGLSSVGSGAPSLGIGRFGVHDGIKNDVATLRQDD